MLETKAQLFSIGTAVPECIAAQEDGAERARFAFGLRMPKLERPAPVFDNAGISERHLFHPLDCSLRDRSWSDRTSVQLSETTGLLVTTIPCEKGGLGPGFTLGTLALSPSPA